MKDLIRPLLCVLTVASGAFGQEGPRTGETVFGNVQNAAKRVGVMVDGRWFPEAAWFMRRSS